MAASHTLSHSHTIRKSGVLVLNGYGVRVQVNAGHLLLHDGIAEERRTMRLPRVSHGLKRLIMIGSDGFITFEALRWISDVGAAFVMLDRRGKVLALSGPVAPFGRQTPQSASARTRQWDGAEDFQRTHLSETHRTGATRSRHAA